MAKQTQQFNKLCILIIYLLDFLNTLLGWEVFSPTVLYWELFSSFAFSSVFFTFKKI